MIRGAFFVLLFYFLGELLSILIHHFVPGSVLGMILLFVSLLIKAVNPESVRPFTTVLTKNMSVFFVPVGVGLMSYFDLISEAWLSIFVAIMVSTVLVIVTVALLQEYFEKHRRNKE